MALYILHGVFIGFNFGIRGALNAVRPLEGPAQARCWTMSLVKEAAPDEEKVPGWTRIGIRRKAAANPVRTDPRSARGRWYFSWQEL